MATRDPETAPLDAFAREMWQRVVYRREHVVIRDRWTNRHAVVVPYEDYQQMRQASS